MHSLPSQSSTPHCRAHQLTTLAASTAERGGVQTPTAWRRANPLILHGASTRGWCFGALVLYCFTALVLWCFVALLLWCFESSLLTFHTCPHVSACLWHVPCGCVHSARDFTTLAKTLRSRYPQRSRGPAYPSLQGLLQRHAASPHRAYDEYMQRLIAVGLGSSPVVFYFLQHSTTAGSDSK